MPERSPRHHSRQPKPGPKRDWKRIISLTVFGMMVLLGPLAFGAVDRIVQVGLVLLLALGMAVSPPARSRLAIAAKILPILALVVVLVKEFAPYRFFGSVRWRTEAVETMGMSFPWSHNPEPARAFDWLLVVLIAVTWLHWVRTLASERKTRLAMMWIVFMAGVAIAFVCLAMKGLPGQGGRIFGIRDSSGWTGWGPFPNRNHSASLLAMAAIVGAGCVAWALAKKREGSGVAGTLGVAILVGALVTSESRGGLLAFGVGLGVLVCAILWRHRDGRTVAAVLVGLALVALCIIAFGTQVIGRIRSEQTAAMSNGLRIDIWRNALVMWSDAPLFGHGVETFGQLFPFYQNLTLDDNVVLHPESSWLLWLTELGAIPLLLILIFVVRMLRPGFRGMLEARSSFYLAAGAIGGVSVLLVQALIDVPAHRWGTAGFALALAGLAFPVTDGDIVRRTSRAVAIVPLAVGLFWLLPFLGRGPRWEVVTPQLLVSRQLSGGGPRPTLAEWREALRYFPLERDLHHFAALAELGQGLPAGGEWQKHFEIVQRLAPGGWRYPILHAKAVKSLSPTLCIAYWQMAIDRSGWRGSELLGQAITDTGGLPRAAFLWSDFITSRPGLALAYAKTLPEEEGRPFFEIWWKARGLAPGLTEEEISDFYRFAPKWSTGEQMEEWIRKHSARKRQDFRVWMELLHGVGRDEYAWGVYSGVVKEPAYPPRETAMTRKEIELQMRLAPENTAYLVELARLLEAEGEIPKAREVILTGAGRAHAPTWFVRKAAYLLAADGQFREAVSMALREE